MSQDQLADWLQGKLEVILERLRDFWKQLGTILSTLTRLVHALTSIAEENQAQEMMAFFFTPGSAIYAMT